MTTTTDYQQQGIDFLAKTNTQFSAKYVKTGKYFTDDKDERDIYEIELKRGSRSYAFTFGQSINNSGRYKISIYVQNLLKLNRRFAHEVEIKKISLGAGLNANDKVINKDFAAPTPYDVLANATKYDPGTFDNFCDEFGYDTDSKKAEKAYNAVKEEYVRLCTLFSPEEMEEMQEIN